MKFKDKASEFAQSFGFDSAQPDEFIKVDGYECYYAANRNIDTKTEAWTPLFDSTPHIIIANENEVKWRTPEDEIRI